MLETGTSEDLTSGSMEFLGSQSSDVDINMVGPGNSSGLSVQNVSDTGESRGRERIQMLCSNLGLWG